MLRAKPPRKRRKKYVNFLFLLKKLKRILDTIVWHQQNNKLRFGIICYCFNIMYRILLLTIIVLWMKFTDCYMIISYDRLIFWPWNFLKKFNIWIYKNYRAMEVHLWKTIIKFILFIKYWKYNKKVSPVKIFIRLVPPCVIQIPGKVNLKNGFIHLHWYWKWK